MIQVTDLNPGKTFNDGGNIYVALDVLLNKTAMAKMVVKVKARNLRTGAIVELSYKSGEKLDEARLDKKQMQYLYKDGSTYVFMDNETYEQVELDESKLEWEKKFLREEQLVEITYYNEEILGISLPAKVTLRITKCEPGVRGDTARSAQKDAELETGLTIRVPLFIEEGEEVIVRTDTSCGYGLFDPKNNCWSREILCAIGIPEKVLPKVVESNTQTGVMKAEMAAELGLTGEVKVIAGGGDAVVQTTGCGAVKQGVFTVTLGTGSLIGASFEGFKTNPYGTPQMFRSNAPGRFMAFGGTGSGGGALAWLKEKFFSEEKQQAKQQGRSVYALMSDMASEVPAGSQGLYFYPQLVGQRCPFEDNDTSGAFIGMRMYHDKRHFVRSLMEGVALCLMDNYDMIREMCGEIKQISITGGGASSDLWCQIHADIFGVEVVRYESYAHGGAVGACIIAGLGIGFWNSLAEAADMMQVDKVFTPNPQAVALYQKMLKVYKGFYPALRQSFKLIAEI